MVVVEACLCYGSTGVSLVVSGLPSEIIGRIVEYTGTGHGHSIMAVGGAVHRAFVSRIARAVVVSPRAPAVPRRLYIELEQCAVLLDDGA